MTGVNTTDSSRVPHVAAGHGLGRGTGSSVMRRRTALRERAVRTRPAADELCGPRRTVFSLSDFVSPCCHDGHRYLRGISTRHNADLWLMLCTGGKAEVQLVLMVGLLAQPKNNPREQISIAPIPWLNNSFQVLIK